MNTKAGILGPGGSQLFPPILSNLFCLPCLEARSQNSLHTTPTLEKPSPFIVLVMTHVLGSHMIQIRVAFADFVVWEDLLYNAPEFYPDI